MKILITGNSDIKGTYEINLNDTILNLLQYVPEHMKAWSYKERFKDMINYITRNFSYILTKNKEYDNKEFAQEIKEYYSLSNIRIKYVYEFLMAI